MLKIRYRLSVESIGVLKKRQREINVENEDEAIKMANELFTDSNDCVHIEKLSVDYRFLEKVQINGVWSFLTRDGEAALRNMEKLGTAIEVDDTWIIEGDSIV